MGGVGAITFLFAGRVSWPGTTPQEHRTQPAINVALIQTKVRKSLLDFTYPPSVHPGEWESCHVVAHSKSIVLPYLLEDRQKDIAGTGAAQERLAPIQAVVRKCTLPPP